MTRGTEAQDEEEFPTECRPGWQVDAEGALQVLGDEGRQVLLGFLDPQFFPDVLSMHYHGLRRQSQGFGDLAGILSLADQLGDFDFPRSQATPFAGDIDSEV